MLKNKCVKSTTDSKIKISADGKSIIFENPTKEEFRKVQIDGCEITEGMRADYLLQKPGVGQIIIEFKGGDIVHAARQILATAEHLKTHASEYKKIAGLVVCNQYPGGANTQFQRCMQEFRKKYNGILRLYPLKKKTYVFEEELG